MTPPTSKEATFVALLDKHQNIIHKICSMYTKGEAAHNDLFQEISIQLWKSYDHFQGKSKFSTWMYRVGLNTSITLFRKEKKRVNTEELQEDITRLNEIDYDPEIDDQLTWLYKKIEHFSEIDKLCQICQIKLFLIRIRTWNFVVIAVMSILFSYYKNQKFMCDF